MRYCLRYPVYMGLLVGLVLSFCHDVKIDAAKVGKEQVWELSSGLDFAYHQSYDIPAWNANGSRLLLRGKKNAIYLVKSIDSGPETLKLPPAQTGSVQWDRIKPDLFYYVTRDKAQTALYSFNLATREAKLLLKAPGNFQLAPGHPDGEHLLLYSQNEGGGIAEIYSLQTRKILIIPLPGGVSRVRFTKANDLSVFCNLETKDEVEKTSWILDAYTGVARQLVTGVAQHPDWQPGGGLFSYFEEDRLFLVNRKGEQIKIIPDISGFQSWSEDGKSLVIDVTHKKSKHYGEIVVCDWNSGELKTLAEHQFVPGKTPMLQPFPHFSPDNTKVVYNSNNQGKNSSRVYIVKVKLPETVKNLRLTPSKNTFELTWTAVTAKEIKSIMIFKIYLNERRVKIGEADSRQTKYPVKAEEGLKGFEVVVKEYSGLESEPAAVEWGNKSVSWLETLF